MEAVIPRIGVLAVGRNTFDVPYAENMLESAWQALLDLNVQLCGEQTLLFDADEVIPALDSLKQQSPDIILQLQVTFTDAAMTMEIARQLDVPLLMWSFPEPRTGGRLRLNSFCGINLAAHALSIFGDHQDVMAVRQTGFALLASGPWEWDETIFARGMLDFSLAAHFPQPPGFGRFHAAKLGVPAIDRVLGRASYGRRQSIITFRLCDIIVDDAAVI